MKPNAKSKQAVALATKAPTRTPGVVGSKIYAYCHIRTNQVLYSLHQQLKIRHLKQLPDLGANNKDASLRKDLWQPFWVLALPETELGKQEAAIAFRHLRELRRLRETNWERPALLSRAHTQDEIDELQKRIDERGGDKKELPFDLIKRQKKKLRVKLVQDQRAASVADLACVLNKQPAPLNKDSLRQALKGNLQYDMQHLLLLAERAEDNKYEALVARQKALVEQLEGFSTSPGADAAARAARQQLSGVEASIRDLDRCRRVLEQAQPEPKSQSAKRKAFLDKVRRRLLSRVLLNEGYQILDSDAYEARLAAQPDESALVVQAPASVDQVQMTLTQRVKFWFLVQDVAQDVARMCNKKWRFTTTPHQVPAQRAAIKSTERVAVFWKNGLDAEFAESWPERVEHKPMRAEKAPPIRHTAPIKFHTAYVQEYSDRSLTPEEKDAEDATRASIKAEAQKTIRQNTVLRATARAQKQDARRMRSSIRRGLLEALDQMQSAKHETKMARMLKTQKSSLAQFYAAKKATRDLAA